MRILFYFFLNKTLDSIEFKFVNEKRVLTIILKIMSKNVKQRKTKARVSPENVKKNILSNGP